MARAAEQHIFEWQLDGAMYSGDSKSKDSAVNAYSRDIELIYSNIEGGGYVQNEIYQDGSSSRALEKAEKIGKLLSEISRPSQRQAISSAVNKSRSATLSPSSEWEGYVVSIGDGTFTVNLADVRDEKAVITDQADFDLSELPQADQRRLEIGSVVRWVVGLERAASDQRQRVSRLYLRRVPVFTGAEYDDALKMADELLNGLVFDDQTR